MSTRRRRKVVLATARMLSPSVRSLVFRVEDDEPFAFEAGQYVDVYAPIESGMVFKRPYSIASSPSPPPSSSSPESARRPVEIEIAVTRVEGGPLSTALHAMPIGARAEVEGPAGVFTRRDGPDDPLLFVATGTGLAPLRSMLGVEMQSASRAAGSRSIAVLFGCRTEADLLWGEELRAWADASALRLEVTLSRPSLAWQEQGGRTGYVQAHVAEIARSLDATGAGGRAHAYVCGLSRMVDDVVRTLQTELGFDRDRVHYEIYD